MSPTARALGIVVAWALFGLAASVWRELVTPWWISAAVIFAVAVCDGIVLRRLARVEVGRRLPGRFADAGRERRR